MVEISLPPGPYLSEGLETPYKPLTLAVDVLPPPPYQKAQYRPLVRTPPLSSV